jgi:protein-export membrane protein SecD
MRLKKFILSWQILLWLFFIIVSIVAINPSFNPNGIIITNIGTGAFYGKIEPKTIIYSAGLVGSEMKKIYKLEDLLEFQGEKGYLILSTNNGQKTIKLKGNEIFNISAQPIASNNLKFGLDIEGGIRALLEPKNLTNQTTVEEIISILETRINIYGLRQAEFRKLDVGNKEMIMVSIAGGSEQEIEDLLSKKGRFDARIPLALENRSSFKLGKFLIGENKKYKVVILNNTTIKINDMVYEKEDKFELSGIKFRIKNLSLNRVVLEGLVFNSEDIKEVGLPPESNFLGKVENGYKFQFGVIISSEGAKRFAELTQNLKRVVSPTGSYLSEKIYFYIDNKEMDSLNIAGDLMGREIANPVITGYGETQEEAIKNRDRLKAILKSGNLPVELNIVSMDRLNPTLGENYLYIISLAGLIAIFLVSTVVFIRYRNLKISIGVIFTMLSEVIIILGFAALTKWNLSTLALAGIVAAIGFGVDDQILIIDETRKKKEKYSLKEGLKRAFFMIFGAGATTIFAMLPILFAGFTAYREIGGFAVTTIVGILAGILITRPAFAKYVEYLLAN